MSDSEPKNPALVADPARNASAAMRGYSYQVLCSVLAWIQLADGEALYLEGAEDFDKVAMNAVTTTQVRDTAASGSVTLRSSGVQKAIGNYWEHIQRNTGRNISFRYLTTAAVGMEQGDPLGEGIPGIELWRRAKDISDPARQKNDLTKLRNFLADKDILPQSMRDFLRTATDRDALDKLIRPMDWVTAAGKSEAIEQAIKERLVEYGEKNGFSAADSESTLDRLYREAWSVASREKSGPLTHAEFVRCFHDASQVSLPKSVAKFLQRFVPTGETAAQITTTASLSGVITRPPPLPPRFFSRRASKEKLRQAAMKSVLVIQGGTGAGKTSAAAEYATESGAKWGWVDLRGRTADETRSTLTIAAEYLETAAPTPIVLDDLECSGDTRAFESALARLANVQRQRGASLVITTAHEMPARLNQIFGIKVDEVFHLEPFSREEIDGFLEARGCADEVERRIWAAFVEVSTLGHPQLVHARVAGLEAASFPKPQIEDMTVTARDILDVQAEARKMLAELDKPSRDLIYRLSVTFGGFSRKRLLAIAKMNPQVDEPGNALDRLIGPWIETMAPDYFRISPLARSAGEEVFGIEWMKKTHRLVARALLMDQTLNVDEIGKILMHATIGEDGPALARLSMGLASADQKVWREIAEWSDWFTGVGITPGTRMPADGKGGLFLARFLQYRIAAAGTGRNIAAIIDRFEAEFPADDTDVSNKLSRFLFLSQILLRNEPKLPLDKVIKWGAEFVVLADELSGEVTQMDERDTSPRLIGPDGKHDIALLGGYALMHRTETAADLEKALECLDALDPKTARRLLWPVSFDESTAGFFVDRVWLSEWKSHTHDWPRLRRLVEATYQAARKFDLANLAVASAAIAIRIVDEHIGDGKAALASSDTFVSEIGDNPALFDAKARVLARQGKHELALDLWRRSLPNWRNEEGDVALSHSYRLAAISSANLGEWGEAADLLARGAAAATKFTQVNLRVALLIDAGFAYWKAGNSQIALKYFAEGIEALDGIQAQAETDEVFGIQKRAGHTMMWVSAVTAGKQVPARFVEPPPACCSSLDEIPADRPEPTPIEFIIEELVDVEAKIGGNSNLFGRYSKRLLSSRYALLRFAHASLAVEHRLRTLELDGLVEAAIEQAHGFVVAREQRIGATASPNTMILVAENRPQLDRPHVEIVWSVIILGLFALTARGKIQEMPLERWREDAVRLNAPPEVARLLDTIEGVFVSGSIEAEQLLTTSTNWADQCVASLMVGTADDTEPKLAVRCHGLWALHLAQVPNRLVIADDVAMLVSNVWRRLSERAFLLFSPSTSVPALRSALATPLDGWAKVKVILSAALAATNLPSNDPARSSIKAIKE